MALNLDSFIDLELLVVIILLKLFLNQRVNCAPVRNVWVVQKLLLMGIFPQFELAYLYVVERKAH